MTEPGDLRTARRHLAKAETMLMSEDGLFHLSEGLALLESVIERDPGGESASIARNLGQTYTARIYGRVRAGVDSDPGLSEPELERLFAVVRVIDDACFDLPADSGDLKVAVVRRLVDYYYEGYSQADKEIVYRQLAELSGDRNV